MEQPKPFDTIRNLTEAINRGDLDKALSLYEPEAVLIVEPGTIARGRDAIRAALAGFISMKPKLKGDADQIVDAGDLVLYCSKWSLRGTSPDGKQLEMTGLSSDVLRRQPDGQWLIAIDNPWGTGIL